MVSSETINIIQAGSNTKKKDSGDIVLMGLYHPLVFNTIPAIEKIKVTFKLNLFLQSTKRMDNIHDAYQLFNTVCNRHRHIYVYFHQTKHNEKTNKTN